MTAAFHYTLRAFLRPPPQKLAELGDPEAQADLAVHLALGIEPLAPNPADLLFTLRAPDPAAALAHYAFAAAAGDPAAQMALGYRHLYGMGVPASCQTGACVRACLPACVPRLAGGLAGWLVSVLGGHAGELRGGCVRPRLAGAGGVGGGLGGWWWAVWVGYACGLVGVGGEGVGGGGVVRAGWGVAVRTIPPPALHPHPPTPDLLTSTQTVLHHTPAADWPFSRAL